MDHSAKTKIDPKYSFCKRKDTQYFEFCHCYSSDEEEVIIVEEADHSKVDYMCCQCPVPQVTIIYSN